jgi:DNA-binding response OmpR family regulator
MRLLWVENHALFARLAGRQFLSGHDLILVPTLAEARSALCGPTFDAILLDYDLDDGKGDSLVASVRQMSPRPVVIATSAHQEGNDALLRAGADAVCSKTRFAEIDTVLSETINRTRASLF